MQISTARLILRPWAVTDADVLFDMARDPIVGRMAGWKPHGSVEESIGIINTVFAKPLVFAIVLRTTNRPIGCIGLETEPKVLRRGPKDAEIGYWIGSRYWNQGYATEALQSLLEHAASIGVPRVWAQCLTDNPASARVLIKCGFKLDHRSLSENPVLGEVVVDLYSLPIRRRARRRSVLLQQERHVVRECDLAVILSDFGFARF